MTCAGGKRKMIDTDAKATALRELEEETAGAKNKIFVELFLSGFFCFFNLVSVSCLCTLKYVHAWLHAYIAYAEFIFAYSVLCAQ